MVSTTSTRTPSSPPFLLLLLSTCLVGGGGSLVAALSSPFSSSSSSSPSKAARAAFGRRFPSSPSASASASAFASATSDDDIVVVDGNNPPPLGGGGGAIVSRRSAFGATLSSLLLLPTLAASAADEKKDGSESMYAPKFVQTYEDFTSTSEGWSYKEVKVGSFKDNGNGNGNGNGGELNNGDRVVFDWSGYTIGYFGRPFEAKGGPQGGAFDKDINYFRTTLGSGEVVPGLECALRTMKPGGIRQVIVPYGPLSYPKDDPEHERVGPKPTTFSGMRALNFVLENERVDRTLLFNVKLIRVDRSDGKGGYIRG